MKIGVKVVILTIGLMMFMACNQKNATNNKNKSEAIQEQVKITRPPLTEQQKELLKSMDDKIQDLSPQDKERYEAFKSAVKEAKTGSELAKVIEKYKDLTLKIRR